jgi:hypothetical protein
VRWQEAPGSKVLKMLKVLKVLNFWGVGWSTIFEFTFIDTAAKGPDPAALGCPLLGEGDALGFAGRIYIEVRWDHARREKCRCAVIFSWLNWW